MPDRPNAWKTLARAVLALLDAGTPTPCTAFPDAFVADRRQARLEAAEACTWCPLLQACGTFALDDGQAWCVWGGVDLTPSAGVAPGRRQLAQRLARKEHAHA